MFLDLRTSYFIVKESQYSGRISYREFSSIHDFAQLLRENGEIGEADYECDAPPLDRNPLMMGLAEISRIAKEDRVYLNANYSLDEFEPTNYEYPSIEDNTGTLIDYEFFKNIFLLIIFENFSALSAIYNHPDNVWGYENYSTYFSLGCIVERSQVNKMVWVKDGSGILFQSTRGAIELLTVAEPGIYYAWIKRYDGKMEYSRKAEVYTDDKGS